MFYKWLSTITYKANDYYTNESGNKTSLNQVHITTSNHTCKHVTTSTQGWINNPSVHCSYAQKNK